MYQVKVDYVLIEHSYEGSRVSTEGEPYTGRRLLSLVLDGFIWPIMLGLVDKVG
jgi:hypothetical protein